jgi:hypothetical protein
MVTDRASGLKLPAQISTVKISALLIVGVALGAMPAFSQGAMTPGGGAMAPQPRVAPAPQAPAAAPQIPMAAPSVNQPVPQPQQRNATSSSNRDHIDEDAPSRNKLLRVINNSETDISRGVSGASAGPAKPTPHYQNNPIVGIDVVVKKKPTDGKGIPTAKTDGSGQTTFRQLEPGIYDVALPTVPGGGTMTVFVNGTPASRTDFPVGSSVGTFAVGNAKDTITLKFESKAVGTTGQQNPGAQKATISHSGGVLQMETKK